MPKILKTRGKMRAKPPTKSAKPVRAGKVAGKTASNEKKEKASSQTPKTDSSVLKKSVDTSVSGLEQAVKLFETGTTEMCDLLSNECSIIYECKVCRNLFRSVANFLAHKRTYCSTKFSSLCKPGKNDQVLEHTLLLGCAKGNTLTSRTTSRGDILSLLDTLVSKETRKESVVPQTTNDTVILKEINTTSEGLFNYNKEIQENTHTSREKTVTLGPDGRVVGMTGGNERCVCSQCHQEFTSSKSLTVHLRTAHGNHRLCIVCPCCKKYFSNTWNVYRHLYSVHRKTSEQVRKLRTQIQKKQVTLEELSRCKTPPARNSVDEKPYDQDRAWMEELEGNSELMRCLGCGKKFERRVALLSHSQACQRRVRRPSKQPDPPNNCPGAPKRSGIEVRMFYEKVPGGVKPPVVQPSIGVVTPLSLTQCCVSLSKCPTPAELSPYQSDKDVKDVVSRYRRDDMDIHNKCRRLEAKLLELHKVAVEEVQGSVSEENVSESKVRECIGTEGLQTQSKQQPESSELTASDDREEVTEDAEETEDVEDQDQFLEKEKDSVDEGLGKLSSGSDDLPGAGFEVIVIEDDEEEEEEDEEEEEEEEGEEEEEEDDEDYVLVTENEYRSCSRDPSLFEESEVASVEMNHTESTVDLSHDSDSSLALSMKTTPMVNGLDSSVCSPTRVEAIVKISGLPQNGRIEVHELEPKGEKSRLVNGEGLRSRSSSEEELTLINGHDEQGPSPILVDLALVNGEHESSLPGVCDSPELKRDTLDARVDSYFNRSKKKCLICNKTFARVVFVRRHVALHLNVFKFKCRVNTCAYKSFLRTDIVNHVLKIHKKRTPQVYFDKIETDDNYLNFSLGQGDGEEYTSYLPNPARENSPIRSESSCLKQTESSNVQIPSESAENSDDPRIHFQDSDSSVSEPPYKRVCLTERTCSPKSNETMDENRNEDPNYYLESMGQNSSESVDAIVMNEKIQALIAEVIFGSGNGEGNGELTLSPVWVTSDRESSSDEWDQ